MGLFDMFKKKEAPAASREGQFRVPSILGGGE